MTHITMAAVKGMKVQFIDEDLEVMTTEDQQGKITIAQTSTTGNVSGDATQIRVYPNPFDEQVFIQVSGWVNGNLHISLRDVLGRECHQEVISAKVEGQALRISNTIPGGIYFLQVTNDQGRILHQSKLIKKD